MSSAFLTTFLGRDGLLPDDPRLSGLYEYLRSVDGVDKDRALTLREFAEVISSCQSIANKCVTDNLKVSDFHDLSKSFAEVFKIVESNTSGADADYIPQLAEVDPDQFAISVTTVDGQHFSIGDSQKPFCIQSCSKPISYLLTLKDFGVKYVHHCVGTEPLHQYSHSHLCHHRPHQTPYNLPSHRFIAYVSLEGSSKATRTLKACENNVTDPIHTTPKETHILMYMNALIVGIFMWT